MNPNSIGYCVREAHWLWRFLWFCCLMAMPWTWFLIIAGVWVIDSRIDDLEEKIDQKIPSKKVAQIPQTPIYKPLNNRYIDTIESCRK